MTIQRGMFRFVKSNLPNIHAELTNAQNMVLARHTLSHYALIYMDNIGNVRVEESPSVRDLNQSFFTPELRERFLKVVRAKANVRTMLIGTLMSYS